MRPTMASASPPDPPRITCCLFAWNEVASFRAVADEQLAALERLGVSYELLVVDDGSSDGTGAAADTLAAERPQVRVIHHAGNQGLGAVYRTCFGQARGTFVTFFPADGQFPAGNLAALYPLAESWDFVLGTLPGRHDSALGALLSRAERLLFRVAVGRLPRLEGIFMVRRQVLEDITLRSQGRAWTVVWELLLRAQRQGRRMTNVPVELQPRKHGSSKVNNLRTMMVNLRGLLALKRLLRDDTQGARP